MQASIQLLTDAGINFAFLLEHGIDHLTFADELIASGIVLNEDITWVTFHGAFDYAYLINNLTNEDLPASVEKFMGLAEQFFPQMYDTKIIAAQTEDIKGTSLQKLANELGVRLSLFLIWFFIRFFIFMSCFKL